MRSLLIAISIFFLLLPDSLSQPVAGTKRLQYKFTSFNAATSTVSNLASVSNVWDLDYTNSYNDLSISRFQIYSDPNFGMQYSGQKSYHTDLTNLWTINKRNFFIQMWFYTCTTDSFVLFSVNPYNGAKSQESDTTRQMTYYSIGVQADGYFYVEISLRDNDANVAIRETTTTLQVQQGWNYIAFDLDEIYEYSYVQMYHRSEQTNTASKFYDKYATTFRGYYDESLVSNTAVVADQASVLVFGCKDYIVYNTAIPNDSVYGLCMKGWIQYMEVYTDNSAVWTTSTDPDTYVKTYTNCAGNRFCNNMYATPIYLDDSITIQTTEMFKFDSSLATLAQAGVPVAKPAHSYYTCDVSLSSTTRSSNPFYQPSIGRITSNYTEYFTCTLIQNPSTSSYLVSFFPAMFTIEAWFRVDPVNIRPDGYISQVFALFDTQAQDYRLGFGMSNTFLRVYLDDTIEDIHYLFNETRSYWHYVAVSYVRHFERQTQVTVFIDNVQAMQTVIFDWFNFNPTSYLYQLHISKDFPGIVKNAKINSRPYCVNSQSLWINTDPTKCVKKGASSCDFCDLDEATGAGTYNCFYTCPNFNNYIDGSGSCTECFDGCRYCKGSSAQTDCYLCNKTAGFVYRNWNTLNTTDVAATVNADRFTCSCSEGYSSLLGGTLCRRCDSRCQTCKNPFNDQCDQCAAGAYKINQNTCSTSCPVNYIKDDTDRICSFDKSLLVSGVKPQDPQGCMDGYFWSWSNMSCSICAINCNTCEFSKSQCTSCPIGRYLTLNNQCSLCQDTYTDAMLVGTNGLCVEKCGDGLQFYGFQQCDDGNKNQSDGCNSQCLVSPNFYCFQPNGTSQCQYLPTELIGAHANNKNDIILNFSRPIYFRNGQITQDDLRLTRKDQEGNTVDVNYRIISVTQPSNYLYLKIMLESNINGGAYRDNIVLIQYQNTFSIFDVNNHEIKQNTYARIVFGEYNYFSAPEKVVGEKYGRIILVLVAGALSFWVFISIALNKSILPALFILLGAQQIFYIGCQDLFLDQQTWYFFTFFKIFRFEHIQMFNIFRGYGWLDLTQLSQMTYNQNLYTLGELQYHEFRVNNSFKIYVVYAYFMTMPLMTLLDFILIQCINLKWWRPFSERVVHKYFFNGPIMLLLIFSYPMGMSIFLQLRFMTLNNSVQWNSTILASLIAGLFFLVWFVSWLTAFLQADKTYNAMVLLKFDFIFKAVKKRRLIHKVAMPLFITRKFASFMLLALLTKYTLGPLLIQTIFCTLMMLHSLVYRPYKSGLTNAIGVLVELTLAAMYLQCIPYDSAIASKQNQVWYLAGTALVGISLCLLFLIIFGWFKIISFFYQLRFGEKRKGGLLRIFSRTPAKPTEKNLFFYHEKVRKSALEAYPIKEEAYLEDAQKIDDKTDEGTVNENNLDTFESLDKDMNITGVPLFKVQDIKKLRKTEMDRYKGGVINMGRQRNKVKVDADEKAQEFGFDDNEEEVDDQIAQMDFDHNSEEIKVQSPLKKSKRLVQKNKKRNKRLGLSSNAQEDDEFKTPGISSYVDQDKADGLDGDQFIGDNDQRRLRLALDLPSIDPVENEHMKNYTSANQFL